MVQIGVEQGIWRLEQDSDSKIMRLRKYGTVVEEWEEDKIYSWEEMYDILLRKAYERRGEN